MASQSWTLVDVDQQTFVPEWKQEIAPGVTIEKRTLAGGKQQGVETIKVQSKELSFEVLPTRGMNIWKIWAGDMEYGWQSPTRGPVHPAFVPLTEPSGLGWLDGFDEVFVRCGLESNGAPEHDPESGVLKYPLHGKIGNLPARKVTVSLDDDLLTISGVVQESRFHFMKMQLEASLSWRIGSQTLKVSDSIRNLSASEHEAQMLYHINFGTPLLDGGSQLVAAAKSVVPRNELSAKSVDSWNSYLSPTPGFEELVYFLKLNANEKNRTSTLLKNAHGTSGVAINFDTEQLPCFTLWKNTTAEEDGYVTGIEPGTNFPNPRTFEGENKRVLNVPAGQAIDLELTMDFLTSEEAVNRAEKEIKSLAKGEPKLYEQPQPGWCHGV